jgi:hypothetical protein
MKGHIKQRLALASRMNSSNARARVNTDANDCGSTEGSARTGGDGSV